MIKVVNKYKHTPTENDVYIGRGSILGNPYTSIKSKQTKAVCVCDSREESINSFDIYIQEQLANKNLEICNEFNRIWKMAKGNGVNLVCFCKPKDCHGDIIKRIIDEKLKEL